MAREQRSCSSGPMTSYGGATTAPRSPTVDGSKRRARKGRISGTGPSGRRGTAADGLRDRPHRTIAAADGATVDRRRRRTAIGATRTTQLSTGARRPCSDRHPAGPPRSESSCAVRSLAAASLLLPRRLGVAGRPAARRGRRADDGGPARCSTGHARVGSWMAIAVHLKNDGPPITGELRLAGGAQGRTRFGTVGRPADASRDKTYVLYAQPPAFGRELEVALVVGRPDDRDDQGDLHDPRRHPARSSASSPSGPATIVGGHRPAAEPEPARRRRSCQLDPGGPARAGRGVGRRSTGSSGRTSTRTGSRPAQLAALRGWVAGGGRLVDRRRDGRPERARRPSPTTLLPVPPDRHGRRRRRARSPALLGAVPAGAADLPALGGELTAGRALATSGDRVDRRRAAVRQRRGDAHRLRPDRRLARRRHGGRGPVAPAPAAARVDRPASLGDDSQLVSAVSQLPSLALPPIGGLIALLGAYILLVGPVNYLVLKRLDRREWAWVTMPVLIVVFAVGAYAFGAAAARQRRHRQRGRHRPRGARARPTARPRSTSASSRRRAAPTRSGSRAARCCRRRSAATSSAATATASALDVLQGDPARVRDLAVGFGSLRTIRAETPVQRPARSRPTCGSSTGASRGPITNASDDGPREARRRPRRDRRGPRRPRARRDGDRRRGAQPGRRSASRCRTGSSGQSFFGDPTDVTADAMNLLHPPHDDRPADLRPELRRRPTSCRPTAPVILAWGSGGLLAGRDRRPDAATRPATSSTTCRPTLAVRGKTTFRGDLMRSTRRRRATPPFFSKDPFSINFGAGSATLAYRPIAFDGTLDADRADVRAQLGPRPARAGRPRSRSTRCRRSRRRCTRHARRPSARSWAGTGCPRSSSSTSRRPDWVRLPHLAAGVRYAVADPARYVDPTTGTVLVRFVNDRSDGVGFSFDLVDRRGRSDDAPSSGPRASSSATTARSPWPASTSTSSRARSSAWSGRTAPARRRRCGSWPRSCGRRAGDAEIAGWSVTRNPDEVRRVLGFMPDVFGVYDDMKVWEYLDFFARCYGIAGGRRGGG